MRLGLQTAKHDDRTLRLSAYLAPQVEIPPERHWSKDVPAYPTLLNDRIGDCAIVGSLHQNMTWQYADDRQYTPTDQQALDDYIAVGHYDPNAGPPGQNPTDNGCILLDTMNYWRRQGIGGQKIGGFASTSPARSQEICTGIELFGGVQLGIRLPLGVQGADTWSVPPGRLRGEWSPGSWGGHRVLISGYNLANQQYDIVSWGKVFPATFEFVEAYADPSVGGEAYVAVSAAWVGPDFVAPNGLSLIELMKDIGQFSVA